MHRVAYMAYKESSSLLCGMRNLFAIQWICLLAVRIEGRGEYHTEGIPQE